MIGTTLNFTFANKSNYSLLNDNIIFIRLPMNIRWPHQRDFFYNITNPIAIQRYLKYNI